MNNSEPVLVSREIPIGSRNPGQSLQARYFLNNFSAVYGNGIETCSLTDYKEYHESFNSHDLFPSLENYLRVILIIILFFFFNVCFYINNDT